jgi:integrase
MYYELPACSGPFKDVIPEYVEYMRGLGYDYGKPILYRLRQIDLFFKQHGFSQTEITMEMFELWEKRRGKESEINQRRRTNILIAFSKYLVLRGFENIYVGESARKIPRNTFIPYIFSKDEISGLLNVFRRKTSECPFDYETAAVAVMISLFYGCGLRKTEALKLGMRDIDLLTGKIRIMDSKNHKSRLVVASESVKRQLFKYCDRFCTVSAPDEYLFRNEKGDIFSDAKLYGRYKKAMTEAGITPRESGRLPRIHDLRHTFCVHTLEAMSSKGFDLYTSLPLLVAYLGHKCISETEYYLRLVEQNFSSVTVASHEYEPELFPKVGGLR